ncbi:MAG: hypothetical protein ACRDL8_09625 [Solirubrobacteraceae bacterium]
MPERPRRSPAAAALPLALPQPDWLRHDLTVTGPATDVALFRKAAVGTGAIPWAYPDLGEREEDRTYALIHPPDGSAGLSLAAARALARQLRDAVEAHHQRALAAAPSSCPFDLHALVPVPAEILALGPDDPRSLSWLQTHWGTTWALRRGRLLPGRRQRRAARLRYEFWSADWTPWPAFQTLRERFPTLCFAIRPDDGV